jgi:hypothetical protein
MRGAHHHHAFNFGTILMVVKQLERGKMVEELLGVFKIFHGLFNF